MPFYKCISSSSVFNHLPIHTDLLKRHFKRSYPRLTSSPQRCRLGRECTFTAAVRPIDISPSDHQNLCSVHSGVG